MEYKERHLNVLRTINKYSNINQRSMAKRLGFSLGKLNFCLKELNKKKLIKMYNFSKNKNKLSYIYLLTPKGILKKTDLTYMFLKKKLREYEELQKELENKNE